MVRLATSNSERSIERSASALVQQFSDDKALKELRFTLAHKLQASLELNTVLDVFFTGIQDFVRTSGLSYSNSDTGLKIDVGKISQHTVAYNLSSGDAQLGSIEFSRNKRFHETELAVLEMFIGVLYFPLRNALTYKEAVESSMRDALTGIGNRAAMDIHFEREIKLAKRHQHPLSIVLVDIDHFKRINDNCGHSNGDKALQQIVRAIKGTLRDTDHVFRYGGEEFVALLNNTGASDAKLIAERIRLNIALSPICLENQDLFCTVSIGISALEDNDTAENLFIKADNALYRAKNEGRNRIELWSPQNNSTTPKSRKSA